MLKAMILKHQYIYLDSYIVLQELFFVAVQILIGGHYTNNCLV